MPVHQGFTVEYGDDLEDALSFAADRGFDFLELNMEHRFDRTRVDADDVRRRAAAAGVSLVVHLPYRLDPGSRHEPVRAGACRELERSVDAAVAMGADRGVMHATSFANPEKVDGDAVRPLIYESVRRVASYARERDFDVVVENVKGPFYDAGDIPELLTETDARACLDTGHALASGYDLPWQADLLAEYGDGIDHVHLNTRRGESGEDEHLPVGIGGRDFPRLLDAMVENDWSGTCTHEVFGFDREYVAVGKRRFDEWLTAACER